MKPNIPVIVDPENLTKDQINYLYNWAKNLDYNADLERLEKIREDRKNTLIATDWDGTNNTFVIDPWDSKWYNR